MNVLPKIILKPGKERSVKLFHPWIFSGAIDKSPAGINEGDLVDVLSSKEEFLGRGHFHNGSIKVRIISFEETDINHHFWINKISNAISVRETMGLFSNENTNSYRLIHGEGDGCPGLIIDIYDNAAVIQSHSMGMQLAKNDIAKAIIDVFGEKIKTIYDKSSETMDKQGVQDIANNFLLGNESESVIKENGILFNVNWVEGQKTGFFLDQRDNRLLLSDYCANKKVLNTFSYSGGFSMYALRAGAEIVHSVDSSKKAGELCKQNASLNNFSDKHEFFPEDAFGFLKKTENKYDVIILDPPAFAKHLSAVENAMVGYRNLNTEAIRKINPGGIIFTFSCSQAIDRTLFRKIVFQAAAQAKRNVRIIHQLNQGPDHPVNIYHPEGEYLKGLVLVVY